MWELGPDAAARPDPLHPPQPAWPDPSSPLSDPGHPSWPGGSPPPPLTDAAYRPWGDAPPPPDQSYQPWPEQPWPEQPWPGGAPAAGLPPDPQQQSAEPWFDTSSDLEPVPAAPQTGGGHAEQVPFPGAAALEWPAAHPDPAATGAGMQLPFHPGSPAYPPGAGWPAAAPPAYAPAATPVPAMPPAEPYAPAGWPPVAVADPATTGGQVPVEPVRPDWVPRITAADVQHMQFGRAMLGYAVHEVDAFLDTVAERLDQLHRSVMAGPAAVWESQPHALQLLQEIRHTRFGRSLSSYAQLQVDTFLDELAEDLEQLIEQFGFERVAARVAAGAGRQDPAAAVRLTPLDIEQQEFSKVPGGYAVAQIDAFLDEVTASYAAAIDRRDHLRRLVGHPLGDDQRRPRSATLQKTPLLTPADIEQQQFDTAMRGYDRREVDSFLDQLAAALSAVLQESADLHRQLDLQAAQHRGVAPHPYEHSQPGLAQPGHPAYATGEQPRLGYPDPSFVSGEFPRVPVPPSFVSGEFPQVATPVYGPPSFVSGEFPRVPVPGYGEPWRPQTDRPGYPPSTGPQPRHPYPGGPPAWPGHQPPSPS
ncbi:MAG TPA: DivIVA domain-containing protein [Actinomycetes bacterium]|nr:DivIVA domain-containing protein [Actinomycetes bacterium]